MGCSVEGCEGIHYARGWCQKHYTRWQQHGDPLITRICFRVGVAEDGRPFCVHGPMISAGAKWSCSEGRRRSRARHIRFGKSRHYLGCASSPEEAEFINQRLREKAAAFREEQKLLYREVADGWVNQAVA